MQIQVEIATNEGLGVQPSSNESIKIGSDDEDISIIK